MARIGYARVSSFGQSLDVQRQKLNDCDRVFEEKQSGTSTIKREQLSLCLDYVRDGDVLVVTKLDRLARSTFDLLSILKRLESKQVRLHVLDQQIDTSTATGMFFTTVLAAVAAFENELRRERQADGIALAKKRGVQLGRKKSLTRTQVAELRERRHHGVKIVELMNDYGVSKASVYRALSDSES